MSQERAQCTELSLLEQLVDAERSGLQPALYLQDHGNMVFMHPFLLPCVRNVSAEVRKQLNYEKHSEYGKDCFKVVNNLFMISCSYCFFFFKMQEMNFLWHLYAPSFLSVHIPYWLVFQMTTQ